MSRWLPLCVAVVAVLFSVSASHAGGAGTSHAAGSGHWKVVLHRGTGPLALDLRGPASETKWAYTLDTRHSTVIKFGTGGRVLATWQYGSGPGYPTRAGVAVGGRGNVFVADTRSNQVLKFDAYGHQLANFTGLNAPVGVAVDKQGIVYVAEQSSLDVAKLSPAGQVLARWHVPWANGAGSGVPVALALDRMGAIYVGADCYREECPPPHGIQYAVIKLNPSGVMESNLLGNNPYAGIAKEEERFVTVDSLGVDLNNHLYVGGTIRGALGRFTQGLLVFGASRGTYLVSLPGNRAPTGIAFDGRNRLYVTQGPSVLTPAS
jgi:DNA-binding beta-propeller fold protein YncE